jgi:hypothetical protein
MQPCPWFSVGSGCCATNRKWLLGICRFVFMAYSAASAWLMSPPTWPYLSLSIVSFRIHSFIHIWMLGILECKQLTCDVLVLVRAGRGSRSAVVCATKDGWWCLFCWIRAPGHGMIEPKAIGYRTGQVCRPWQPKQGPEALQPLVSIHFSLFTCGFVQTNADTQLKKNKCRHFRHCTLRTNTFRDFRLYFFRERDWERKFNIIFFSRGRPSWMKTWTP